MAACPNCTADLPAGLASVCPSCGYVVRIPGVAKLGLTLLAVGFAAGLVWALEPERVFLGLWAPLAAVLEILGVHASPPELTGTLKDLVDFVFGTRDTPPWGGVLLIFGGLAAGGIGAALLRRAESRGSPA